MSNDHGWKPLGRVGSFDASGVTASLGSVSYAPIVDERKRCGCPTWCQRPATQEDLLCDECRETCAPGL